MEMIIKVGFSLDCKQMQLYFQICSKQLDSQEQTKQDRPGAEGHSGKKPWVPSNGQN